MSQMDGGVNSTTNQNNTTLSELNAKANKKKEKKRKGMDADNVAESGGIGGVGSDDFPGTKKRRKGGKTKAGQDDVVDDTVPGESKKKSKRKKQNDPTTTNATDFGANT